MNHPKPEVLGSSDTLAGARELANEYHCALVFLLETRQNRWIVATDAGCAPGMIRKMRTWVSWKGGRWLFMCSGGR